jgi:formiminotetrahydrofolate cyclodeaminase
MAVLKDLSLVDYLAKTASGDPVPGGGSSAALNASLAAALIEMVAQLTIGRKNFESVDAELRAVTEKASTLRHKLMADIDHDSDSYAQVL